MSEERFTLDALLEVMREHDLDALTVRSADATYELVRRAEPVAASFGVPAAVVGMPAESVGDAPDSSRFNKVAAPIVGVFYRAPSPGADAFVDIGDRVEVGQVLCILEAMKLMNEITSDYAGIVRRVLPENGALVSLDEEMFWIEP